MNEDEFTYEPIIEDIPEAPPSMVMLDTIASWDPNHARLARMTQVISKFAGTLTLRPIGVELAKPDQYGDHNKDAPAWSDSENIWFNENLIGDLTEATTVASLKGLSLHEIAHILMTPRNGSNLAKEVQREGLWKAFNALEDQRIEMAMTKKYGNVADWFIATFAKFIADDPTQHSFAFVIAHGRKYLPQNLRTALKNMYENQNDVAELSSLIDAYIVLNLNDPSNYPTALTIIRRYNELVNLGLSETTEQPWGTQTTDGWSRIKDPNGHHDRKHGEWKSNKKSKPLSKSEQERLTAKIADEVAKQKAQEAQASQPGDQNGEPTGVPGSGASGPDTEAMTDLANKIVDGVLSRKAKDIANTVKQFSGETDLRAKGKINLTRGNYEVIAPSPDAISRVRSFARELEQLKADFDPGWNRRVDQGRLNIQRYMDGSELDECFDEWDNGRDDAIDIEAVIILDTSGSMCDVSKDAYEAMWVMKRALDKVNATTTVVEFSSWTNIVYAGDERATSKMRNARSWGGTDPQDAVRYARNVLAESDRAIKVFIAITDGEWYYGNQQDESDKIILDLRRSGVITALAFLQTSTYVNQNINTHNCEVAADLRDVKSIFTLARNIVRAGVKRNLERA